MVTRARNTPPSARIGQGSWEREAGTVGGVVRAYLPRETALSARVTFDLGRIFFAPPPFPLPPVIVACSRMRCPAGAYAGLPHCFRQSPPFPTHDGS